MSDTAVPYIPKRWPTGSPDGKGGKYLPGYSGFPGGALGQGREAKKKIRDLARSMSEDVLGILKDISKDNKAHPSARVQACTEILNRGWGRPDVELTMTVKEVVQSMPDNELDSKIDALLRIAKAGVEFQEAKTIDVEAIPVENP